MSRFRPGPLVEISWSDIEHEDFGWQELEAIKAKKAHRYRAVGYLVKRGRRFVLIVPVIGESAAFCAYRIPRGAVRSIRRLK